jgi:hypothetical protein
MTDILRLSVPVTVWLAAFSAVYGLSGLVCASRWADTALAADAGRPALMAAEVAAIAVQFVFLAALASSRWGSPSTFVRSTSLGLGLAATVASVWTLFPIAVVSPCH